MRIHSYHESSVDLGPSIHPSTYDGRFICQTQEPLAMRCGCAASTMALAGIIYRKLAGEWFGLFWEHFSFYAILDRGALRRRYPLQLYYESSRKCDILVYLEFGFLETCVTLGADPREKLGVLTF